MHNDPDLIDDVNKLVRVTTARREFVARSLSNFGHLVFALMILNGCVIKSGTMDPAEALGLAMFAILVNGVLQWIAVVLIRGND